MEINTKEAIAGLLSFVGLGAMLGVLTATLIEANAIKTFSSTPPLLAAIVSGLTAYMLTKTLSSAISLLIFGDLKPSLELNFLIGEAPGLAAFCGGVLGAIAVQSILR